MINRVAGVFARRGYNIESLAVGLNVDRALFTIVVTGTDGEVSQLLKQIYKLPNVIRADDLTYAPSVERGLMLLQLDVEAAGRREVLDLATIFRASVVDVSERSLMLSCTGDPGKLRAFQRALSHYPVRALARTGKLSLRREAAYNEQRRLQLASAARSRAERAPDDGGGKEAEAEGAAAAAGAAAGAAAAAAASAAPGSAAASSGGGDVYKLEPGDATGVWDYAVLTPHWGDGAGWGEGGIPHKKAGRSAYKPHTLSLLVDNAPGVLDRVTGVIARRGYNVQSLGVGPAEAADVSRITLVVPGTPADVAKLLTQLLKLPAVRAAEDITAIPFVERELMLIKVAAPPAARSGLMDLASVFRAKVSDISGDTLTVEVVGDAEKLAQLQGLLGPFGVLEVARTGRVALTRDAGVNTALLEELASDSFFS